MFALTVGQSQMLHIKIRCFQWIGEYVFLLGFGSFIFSCVLFLTLFHRPFLMSLVMAGLEIFYVPLFMGVVQLFFRRQFCV